MDCLAALFNAGKDCLLIVAPAIGSGKGGPVTTESRHLFGEFMVHVVRHSPRRAVRLSGLGNQGDCQAIKASVRQTLGSLSIGLSYVATQTVRLARLLVLGKVNALNLSGGQVRSCYKSGGLGVGVSHSIIAPWGAPFKSQPIAAPLLWLTLVI